MFDTAHTLRFFLLSIDSKFNNSSTVREPMNTLAPMPESDPAHFLKIAGEGAGLSTHADLWRWLQGDVQKWLCHDIMVVGWGDFRSGELHHDIVSSLPGVRSHNCAPAHIAPLINYFRDCWTAAQHAPCQLDIRSCLELLDRQGWGAGRMIRNMRTAFVHGIGNGKHGGERIFAALSEQPVAPATAGTALKLLLPFIDSALRRMPPAPVAPALGERPRIDAPVERPGALSERERQIMTWVAMGKTNPEIGCILEISEFTVKNHMKSIFSKLDVTNRAQAVAKMTRMGSYA
jgi:transcriptional regulator EpsA